MRIFTIIFLIACAVGTSIKTFNDANYKEYLDSGRKIILLYYFIKYST